MTNKTCGNRATELLQLMLQVLEAGTSTAEPDTQSPVEKKQESDIGKNQPVGDYPDSPLRYRGGGR